MPKKKEGILQEIFARFTNFNFCRWVTSQVAIDSSHKKQRYKVCFSDAAYACRLFFNGSPFFPPVEKLPQKTVIYYSTESKISKKDKGPIGS